MNETLQLSDLPEIGEQLSADEIELVAGGADFGGIGDIVPVNLCKKHTTPAADGDYTCTSGGLLD